MLNDKKKTSSVTSLLFRLILNLLKSIEFLATVCMKLDKPSENKENNRNTKGQIRKNYLIMQKWFLITAVRSRKAHGIYWAYELETFEFYERRKTILFLDKLERQQRTYCVVCVQKTTNISSDKQTVFVACCSIESWREPIQCMFAHH